MSGVAHDSISQIERDERLARASTAQKLAAALDVSPFILASSIEELAAMTVGELFERVEEELSDYDAAVKAVDKLRAFLIEFGYGQEVTWEEFKAAARYEDLRKSIDAASEKLSSPKNAPYSDQLVDMTEAALILAHASAHLMRFVTSVLKADDLFDNTGSLLAISQRHFARPLADAWIEGAGATKDFRDVIDKAPRPPGELALDSEPEIEGGEQEEAATER